jgi:hypothetical protein
LRQGLADFARAGLEFALSSNSWDYSVAGLFPSFLWFCWLMLSYALIAFNQRIDVGFFNKCFDT